MTVSNWVHAFVGSTLARLTSAVSAFAQDRATASSKPVIVPPEHLCPARPPRCALVMSSMRAPAPVTGLFGMGGDRTAFLKGNTNFQGFIGFLSNPVQNIDPRAVTEIWPIFGSSWASAMGRSCPAPTLRFMAPASTCAFRPAVAGPESRRLRGP